MWNQTEKNIYVAGHRGYSEKYPENTLLSFQKAVEAGVDMLELDIQMTKDHQLVIMHDLQVDRTTNGSGSIKEKTLSEIRQLDAGSRFAEAFRGLQVPLFSEFLELFSGNNSLLFNFELKERPLPGNEERAFEAADLTIELVEKYRLGDRCVFNTFSARLLQYIAERYDGKYRLHGYHPLSLMGEYERDPYSYLYCMCISELDKALFSELKAKQIEPWVGPSIYTKEKIRQAADCGATLITCNNPETVLSILMEEGLRRTPD